MHYNNYKGKAVSSSKINFKQKKENMVSSLYDIENFLHHATKIVKGFKFYSFFK